MKISKVLAGIAGFLFLLSLLLTVIEIRSFSRDFYVREFEKGNQSENIGMSDEDLMRATDTLLDYIRGRREDIVCVAEVRGSEREVYNPRETLHMVDVRDLYSGAVSARNWMTLCSLILIAAACRLSKDMIGSLQEAYRTGFVMLSLLVIFCLVYAMIDFNDFWIRFHYVFFDNELFFLDPNTSIMINMYTETLFFDLVISIIVTFAACTAACGIILHLLKGRIYAEHRSV